MSAPSILYRVQYIHADGSPRLGHVKAIRLSEAQAKAKRFVIKGGNVISVVEA